MPGLNAASGGSGGARSFTAMQGQTLADIARITLGDERLWYRIAQANALASAPICARAWCCRFRGAARLRWAIPPIGNAMIANAATQGISVALGLQDRFDWRGVAASGLAAGVGYETGKQLATTDMSPLAQKMVRGAVAGTVGTVVRGGKLSLAQLATDAFGQVNAADFARQSLALGGANSAYGAEEMAGYAVREGNRFASAAHRNRQEAQAELTLAMNDTLVDLFSNPMYPYRVNSGYGVQVADARDRLSLAGPDWLTEPISDAGGGRGFVHPPLPNPVGTALHAIESRATAAVSAAGGREALLVSEISTNEPMVDINDPALYQAGAPDSGQGLKLRASSAWEDFGAGWSSNGVYRSVLEGEASTAYTAGRWTRAGVGLVYDGLTGYGDFERIGPAWRGGDYLGATMYATRGAATAGMTAMTLGDFALAKAAVGGVAGSMGIRLGAGEVASGGAFRSWKTASDNTYFKSAIEFDASVYTGSTGISYKVVQRRDIDWQMVRESGSKQGRGLTNAEAAGRYGIAPILPDGSVATLHHSQQSATGPLFEASTRYHNISNAQRAPLHPFGSSQHPEFPLGRGPGSLREAFQRIDSLQYWKWRGQQELGR